MALKYKETGFTQDKTHGENVYTEAYNDPEFKEWISKGRFSQVIKELAAEADFQYLIDKSESPLKDQELVVRFAAFYLNGYENYYGPTSKFINDTLAQYRDIAPRDEVRLRADFRNSIQIIRSLFSRIAFKRFHRGDHKNHNGRWETQKLNVSLFDILMYSFARLDRQTVMMHKDNIDEALIDLMTTDQEFIDSIELATGNKIIVSTRFDKWIQALDRILNYGENMPESFSYPFKFDLYSANNTCTHCGTPIGLFDDSTFARMDQYWVGDKAIPAHAQLAHRYCKSEESRESEK